jgi:hypothetical protein
VPAEFNAADPFRQNPLKLLNNLVLSVTDAQSNAQMEFASRNQFPEF